MIGIDRGRRYATRPTATLCDGHKAVIEDRGRDGRADDLFRRGRKPSDVRAPRSGRPPADGCSRGSTRPGPCLREVGVVVHDTGKGTGAGEAAVLRPQAGAREELGADDLPAL